MNPFPKLSAHALGMAALFAAVLLATPAQARLDVEIWTDRGDDAVYREGDAMRVKVRTSEDAFLLVYEIDTEGHVNLLYPWKRGSGRVEGRSTLRLPPDQADYQLVVEKETGQGFLVAVASERPFRELPWFLRPFDPQAASMGYEGAPENGDEEGFDDEGRVLGDPYVAMERIRRRVMQEPGDLESFASAYSTYYVHEQVRYPRYICNDCHRPGQWAWWSGYDPYYTRCSVFDFRVNWGWSWGPQIWTAYVPYYYYVVRTDCPPRYAPWVGNRNRFSSWDGRNRWTDLWGGQLRRYKPGAPPVAYTPPAPRGMIWRKGETPPGFVPKDVQRQGSGGTRPKDWLARDVGNGRTVWRDRATSQPVRDLRRDPNFGGEIRNRNGGTTDAPRNRWFDRGARPDPARGGDTPDATPKGEDTRQRDEGFRRGGGIGGSGERQGGSNRPVWTPRNDPPRNDPPRNDPPRQEPPRQGPVYKEPPRNDPPRWSPPPQSRPDRPDPPRGKGGNGKG